MAASLCVAAHPALAEAPDGRPTLNLYGASGLIDMPSAEVQPDGKLTFSSTHFGPVSRTTLSFQATPRFSASFRFIGFRDWSRAVCPPSCRGIDGMPTYYDRSFDLRYQILREGRYLPALAVGLQDFAGTRFFAGEYLVATKTLAPGLKASAGLGWGRLGTHGSIGSPFGERMGRRGAGFTPRALMAAWFRGPAAPFAGVEWQVNDRWGLKAEYSSDAYVEEVGRRKTFERKSPYNFGVEYQPTPGTRIGAYYMYGSTIGIAGHFLLDPKVRPGGGTVDSAPVPIRPRESAAALGWTTEWTAQPDATSILAGNIARLVKDDGILVEGLATTGISAELRIRNTRLDAGAQAIGRSARAMARALPPSVESFEIVTVEDGMAASKVVLRRSDLEALEFAPDGAEAMRARARIEAAGRRPDGMVRPTGDDFRAFTWSLAPYQRLRLFDEDEPGRADVGLRATARYEFAPGLTVEGAVTQRLIGTLDRLPPIPTRGRLHPVRSAVYWYDRDGSTAIETLTLNWNTKLSRDVYGRVTFGYLERMFGGVSAEVLWKPVDSRLAIGVEVNYTAQRSTDGGLGFKLPQQLYQTRSGPVAGPSSYKVASGHLSVYYALPQGFNVQLDVGQYLARDVGATLSIDREFANGWRVGAFATKTNVSGRDFGSGSFDKGIRVEVPFAWVLGKPLRKTSATVLRPFGRDGGARLELDNRLYDTVRHAHTHRLDDQWGRFWK